MTQISSMARRLAIFSLQLALFVIALALPSPAQGQVPPPEKEPNDSSEWIVVGIRQPEEASIAPLVDDLRKALANELGPKGSAALGAQTILARLGISSAPVSTLLTHISDAEGAYQQFSLDAAREKFQAGIQELGNVSGEPAVWDASLTARVLLAMVYLAAQERDAAANARSELESILRVAPDFRASGYSGDPVFLALFKKAEQRVRRLPRGTLRVTVPGRTGAQVWVDTAPKGPSEKIELPVGTYHVRVTDDRDSPRLRSFTHVVTIKEAEETLLTVNLDVEGTLDPAGPAFALPLGGEQRSKLLSVLGRHLGSGRLAFIWFDGQKNLRLAIGDAMTGELMRGVAVANSDLASRANVISQLAAYAASGRIGASLVTVAPTFGEVQVLRSRGDASRQEPLQPQQPSLVPPLLLVSESSAATPGAGLKIGAWASGGAAVAMAAIGIALTVHASTARTDLDNQFMRNGSVLVPYGSQATYGARRGELLTTERWGVGLIVGAAIAAVASATLFALDVRAAAVEPRLTLGGTADAPLGFCLGF